MAALRAAFRDGSTDPSSVLGKCWVEIERRNPALNAIVHSDRERADGAAAASDARWRDGAPLSAIDGAPIAVKANCAVGGLPWTAALRPLARQIAAEDSAVVRALRNAGAVILGLANMHEAALGATTTSPLYGPCFNPMQPGYTPGGSSGGSAAAVAAGFCLGAIGTDTMGSVRVPSAYCGIVGFKPSFGRLSTRGVIPLSPTLDHVGFHANTVADVAVLYDACAQESIREAAPEAFRVGVVRTNVDLEPQVAAAFADAVTQFQEAGAYTIEVDWRSVDLAQVRRRGLLVCERELVSAMPQVMNDPALLSPELAAMLNWAMRQPRGKLDEARAQLKRAREHVEATFAEVDVLVLPTTPQVAFAQGAATPENQADLTAIANVAGVPAVCLPIGGGLLRPSLQVLAPRGRDARALEFATFAERICVN
jgi:aspartyl-tRNA(Asn)/glutamyl-tRNA(Gln) amidotransferase subunit A